MTPAHPAKALDIARRIEMMCDFIENPAIRKAIDEVVPLSMPRAPGALGFDISLWVGLGTVGLWAALDAFADSIDDGLLYFYGVVPLHHIVFPGVEKERNYGPALPALSPNSA